MSEVDRQLTRKGQATKERILEAAAALMAEQGVTRTTNDQVRRAAGVSGSQLMHYFPDRAALVSAVLDWRARGVRQFTELAAKGRLDTFEGIEAWMNAYVEREESCVVGCSFGSLAGELIKLDTDVKGQLFDGFDQWEELFRAGLRSMRARGELNQSADPVALANVLMAAFQGGMLLAQTASEPSPLRDALDGALGYLKSFREVTG